VRDDAALGAAFVIAALLLTTRSSAALASSGAPADAAGEPVRLVYEAAPRSICPTRAEFELEVEKLTSRARFTGDGRARLVRIELRRKGGDFEGRLVTGRGEAQSSRELRGKTCEEVASALAIAVALTIDPDALLGSDDSEPAPPSVPEPAPEPKAPPSKPAEPRATPAPSPPRLRFGAGLGLALESAWSPRLSPGGKLFALGAYGERVRFALGVTRFVTREVDQVSFGAWVIDAAVSYQVAMGELLKPFVSIGYELGVVRASGSGLPLRGEAERPWQAACFGLGLRVERGPFFFQLGGDLLVPISRQRYLVSDPSGGSRALYEVPTLGVKQETSLGVFL
jgi:hypothetical protein